MRSLLLALLAVLLLGLKRAFELVLEKEYATWAPALARVLVRAAGFVYWPRRGQWSADLRYVQQVEDESGLLPAGWCLLSAPWLLFRHVVGVFNATCRRQWAEHVSFPRGLVVAGVIRTLIVGVDGGLVGAHPVSTVSMLSTASIEAIAFSPDGKTILTGGDDGMVRLWHASTGKEIGQPPTGHIGPLPNVAFSPDGKTIAAAGDYGTMRLWDSPRASRSASA